MIAQSFSSSSRPIAQESPAVTFIRHFFADSDLFATARSPSVQSDANDIGRRCTLREKAVMIDQTKKVTDPSLSHSLSFSPSTKEYISGDTLTFGKSQCSVRCVSSISRCLPLREM